MEISQTLTVESFSYSWLVNIKPPFESFEELFGTADDSDEASLFIEMDPKLPASRRFFSDSREFNFDFPTSDSPVALVHADELISNGFLLPLFAKPKKMEPYNDVPYSTPSTLVSSHAHKNVGFDNKVFLCCSSFRRYRKFSKRILRKYLELVMPVFQKFKGRSSGPKTEGDAWNKQEENSVPMSTRISVAYSVDNWRRSFDYEGSIHEAVLHCKRSIGK